MIDFYYKKLSENLSAYNLDIDQIYNRTNFLLAIQDYMTTIKLIAIIYVQKEGIDGDLEKLSKNLEEILIDDRIHRENCYEIMNKKLNNNDYELIEFSIKPASSKIGYLGEHQLLNIKVEFDDSTCHSFHFFVKFLPIEKGYYDLLEALQGFDREVLFYADVFEKMKLLNINVISEVVPEFYLARKNRFLIFNDLVKENYKMRNKYDQLDLPHFECFLRSLARLHASSVIFEERMTNLLNHEFRICNIAPKIFTEPIYNADGILCGGFEGILFVNQKFLPEYHVDNFEEKLKRTRSIFLSSVERSTKYRNVLSHGDLWTNNIMFRYNDRGDPINCRLVDFQIGRYIPQANDVMAAMYLMINREIRQKHQQTLLQKYFEFFCTELKNYSIDPDDVITYSEFLDSCEEMNVFALVQKACQYHFIMMAPEFEDGFRMDTEKQKRALHCNRSELIEENWNLSAAYRDMMRDCHIPVFEYFQNVQL